YGATTGRPRRCGWLDAVAVRYAVMINGISSVALTKLDVLSDMPEIKICTKYERTTDGKVLDNFTTNLQTLASIRPIYESFEGWKKSDLDGITDREDLPKNVKTYLDAVESELGAPLNIISLGAGRNETLISEPIELPY
ncbi:MAG: adenylosuccinate synthetase, partial [Candidatus Kapaibacterium sp.]